MIPFFWHGPLRNLQEAPTEAESFEPALDGLPAGTPGFRQEDGDEHQVVSSFELPEVGRTPSGKMGCPRKPLLRQE